MDIYYFLSRGMSTITIYGTRREWDCREAVNSCRFLSRDLLIITKSSSFISETPVGVHETSMKEHLANSTLVRHGNKHKI